MTTSPRSAVPRLATLGAALGAAALLSACVVEPVAPRYVQAPRPAPVYEQPAPYAPESEPVVSVYVDPPIDQPEPIAVQWAPPPMLVEMPPPQPYPDAVWTGGYWAWEGRWFWAAGRWAPPPRPRYFWVQPYYEHRADVVVFVPGFWCAPERRFVPPAPGLSISIALAAPGIRHGRPPMGPQGVFVPPPPGSRAGLIVAAPIGTPPAVVVSAPAVINPGMRVRGNVDINSRNVTNNITNVTVEAPANVTANGQAFQNSVPARANLAAGMAPAGRPLAPLPASQQQIPAYQAGRAPMPLPAGQPMRGDRANNGNPGNPGYGGGRPAMQPPAMQPPQAQQQPQTQPTPQPGQAVQGPQRSQMRPPAEFETPPRQPAPVGVQPGQQPQGAGQPQRQPGPGYGQAPQGQPQAQPAAQMPAQQPVQAQQPAQPPTAPQQLNPQDQRRRGGNPQRQPAAQPDAQPAAQGQQAPAAQGQQPPAAQAQPAAGKPKEAREKDERRRPERERREDRDKKDGDRER